MGGTLSYARISTNEGQDIESQKVKVEKPAAMVVFTDGSHIPRPEQFRSTYQELTCDA